jgi:hypothetical protein
VLLLERRVQEGGARLLVSDDHRYRGCGRQRLAKLADIHGEALLAKVWQARRAAGEQQDRQAREWMAPVHCCLLLRERWEGGAGPSRRVGWPTAQTTSRT